MRLTMPSFPFFTRHSAPGTCDAMMPEAFGGSGELNHIVSGTPAVIACTRLAHGSATWHFDSTHGVTWRWGDGKGDWLR
jgi:hypothetical protein